jgi:hypothetical protein
MPLPSVMEKTMKRFTSILVCLGLLVAFAMPAQAAWNIRQKANGSTVWVDPAGIEVPVGSAGLVVYMTDMSTAQTVFVATHKKGKIKKVYALAQGAHGPNSNSSVLTIGIGTGASAAFTPISTGATISVPTTQGVVGSVSPSDVNVNVSQGYVISVASDGGGNSVVPGMITIVIE